MLKQLKNINIFFFVSFQCPAGLSRIVRIDPCAGTQNITCQSKSMPVFAVPPASSAAPEFEGTAT